MTIRMMPGFACLLFAMAVSTVPAATPTEKEFYDLRAQRDKAAEQALKQINDRYRAQLESLQKRATQAGDLDTALLIKNELVTQPQGGGTKLTKKTFESTIWYWDFPKTGKPWQFLPDGKILDDGGGSRHGWHLGGNDRLIITMDDKDWFEFNIDLDAMEGRGGHDKADNIRIKFHSRISK